LKELGLNEYSAIGKEVNDKFMNLQEKISGLSSSAKTMFRFGVEKLGMNLMEAETLSKMVDKNVKLGVEDDYAVRDAIRDSIESKKTPEQKTQDVKQFKENKSQFVDMAKTSKDGKDFYNKVTKEIKTGTFSGGQFGGWFNKEYGASTPQKSLEKFMKDVKSGKFDDKKQITKSMNYQDEIRKANTDQMNKIDGLWKCDSTKKKKEAIEDELNEEDKNKLIKKAVESGDLSDLSDEIGKALTTVLEAKEDGSLAELLKGGKVAQIGETRMHGGKKMKKTAKGWEPAGEGGEKGKGEKKDSPDDSDKIEKFYQNMLWSIGEDKHFATKEIAIYALRENGKNRKKAGKTAESKMMFDVADKLEGGGKNTNKLDGFKSDVRDELKRMDYTDDQIDKKLKKESNFLKEASEQNQHYTKVAQQLR